MRFARRCALGAAGARPGRADGRSLQAALRARRAGVFAATFAFVAAGLRAGAFAFTGAFVLAAVAFAMANPSLSSKVRIRSNKKTMGKFVGFVDSETPILWEIAAAMKSKCCTKAPIFPGFVSR